MLASVGILFGLTGSMRADYPLGFAQAYVDAVNEAMGSGAPDYRPNPAGVVDNLTVITDTNPELTWQEGSATAQGHVLMASFTDYTGYTTSYVDSVYRSTLWATAAPELHDFLRENEVAAGGVAERTKQLLGMPSSHPGDRVVELWVRRDNLRRPCRDPDVTNPVSSLEFPDDVDTKYPGHRAQFLANLSTYSTAGGNTPYPWTQLGYTYDWGNSETNQGLTEFWVGAYNATDTARTEVAVYAVFSIGSYPYWNRDTLSFDITGDCDTVWAGDAYVPTTGDDMITIRSGATVYQGILISSGGYIVTNQGTLLGPGRNSDRTFRAAVLRFNADGMLINTGTIAGQIAVEAVAGEQFIQNAGVLSGTQFAIKTADADDMLFNSGTIDGSISTGDGDDMIFLTAGSVTGDIDGGGGSDSLLVAGGSDETVRMTGNIANVDAVGVLSGTARIDGNVDAGIGVAAGATLTGNTTMSGSLTNEGTVSPGNSIGTMTVGGDYTQEAGAVLDVELAKPIEGLTDSDRVVVAGDATLASGAIVHVRHAPGDRAVFRLNDWFAVITAGGAMTDNGAVVQCDSDFLSFTGGVWGASYTVTAQRTRNFADAVSSANDRQLARALDADGPAGVNDFASLVNDLLFMTESQFQQSVASLSPGVYLAARAAEFRTTQFLVESQAERMRIRRATARQAAMPAGYRAQSPAPGDAEPVLAYVRSFGLFFDEPAASERVGFRASSAGVDTGVERQLNDRVFGGLGFAYANTGITFRDGLGTGTLNVLRVGPYLSFVGDEWFADASASYGYHDNSVRRNVAVGSIAEAAEGQYHANDVSVYLGLGRLWETPDRIVSPVASIQYIVFDQPGFTEHDASAAGLTLGNHSAESLRTRLGLEATRWSMWHCLRICGDWSAGWAHEYLADDPLNAHFTGGTTRFRTERHAGYRDSAYFTAGLAVSRGNCFSLVSRYTGELAHDGAFHAIDLGLTAAY